jgi:hypothetical protein
VALLEASEEKIRRIRGDEHPYTKVVTRNLARLRARITAQNTEAREGTERKKGHSLYTRIKKKFGKRHNAE